MNPAVACAIGNLLARRNRLSAAAALPAVTRNHRVEANCTRTVAAVRVHIPAPLGMAPNRVADPYRLATAKATALEPRVKHRIDFTRGCPQVFLHGRNRVRLLVWRGRGKCLVDGRYEALHLLLHRKRCLCWWLCGHSL